MAAMSPKSPKRVCSQSHLEEHDGLRKTVSFATRRFDPSGLPADMLRVYTSLKERFDEEYALLFVFNMQTAMEMHRAWNMTLLTSKTLKKCSEMVGLTMTWELGVIKLKFFMEDGDFELQRKVPYDYDSEFQDMFMRIASALYNGHMTVHEALLFQEEAKQGKHTAKTGLFIRDYPGRLIVLPAMSSTCAVIFFGGSEKEAGVAALCGLVSGLIEYGLLRVGGDATLLIDLAVGLSTGFIGSLFYQADESYCLVSIFMGTLYWFFYGTAFVVGLVEILAGELETGVTRFMAVSIKTFVLCVMACFGMLLAVPNPGQVWEAQSQNCGVINLADQWWRVPLYLACSLAVLGQYRFRLEQCWRGLLVQLAGYEVQFQVTQFFQHQRERLASSDLTPIVKDNFDVMASNVCGAAASVVTACTLSAIMDFVNSIYYAQLLQRGAHRDETDSKLDDILFGCISVMVKCFNCIGIGRKHDKDMVDLEKKIYQHSKELRDPSHPRSEIKLEPHEEDLLLDTIVYAESMNIWSMLMPAVYQLVPGSMIARMWFNTIIPPSDTSVDDNTFAGLMVTSISLALGLIIGEAIVELFSGIANLLFKSRSKNQESKTLKPSDRSQLTTSATAADETISQDSSFRL
ncbi:PLRG1 [Symbiodinium microadriaticum]|nr:PLRG1 [Symbiodinium microadriaticum]